MINVLPEGSEENLRDGHCHWEWTKPFTTCDYLRFIQPCPPAHPPKSCLASSWANVYTWKFSAGIQIIHVFPLCCSSPRTIIGDVETSQTQKASEIRPWISHSLVGCEWMSRHKRETQGSVFAHWPFSFHSMWISLLLDWMGTDT